MSFNSFENLDVWKNSRVLNKTIYDFTNRGSFSSDFSLKDQMRRASISISSNIAEGVERRGVKQSIYFLEIAKGSAGELRSQLFLSLDLEYFSKEEFDATYSQLLQIEKMIGGLIRYLKNKEANHEIKKQ